MQQVSLETTRNVLAWIEARQGKEIADLWFWEFTPLPIGLPSPEQADEGMTLALTGKFPDQGKVL